MKLCPAVVLVVGSLEGNELKICGGDNRPTELESKPNSESILFVFKREQP